MDKFEIKISKYINHFNNSEYFLVEDVDTAEALHDDFELFDDAVSFLFKIIEDGNGKYFTNQDLIENGDAYRLSRLGNGSEKYGSCEICGQSVDSTYLLVHMKRYWCSARKKDRISHFRCRGSIFGHKSCLTETTNC
jgi:hypothetical protein